jgi:DNA invertase Pin-like site-specific DNA recombinase
MKGDTLVVWRLDRLGRSLKDLIDWVQRLKQSEINFLSLQENIDTSTAAGELIFHVFGALA